MPVLYVDVANPVCSDAVTYAQAQDPGTPLCSLAPSTVLALPGDIVHVKAGTYALSSTWLITKSGAPGQPITYSADQGVVIIGPSAPSAQGVIVSGASHVIVEGFEIMGSNETGLRCTSCADVILRHNRVHDNGRGCTAQTKCGQGIAANSAANADVTIEANISYHNGSGTSLDHCYYLSGTRTIVRNNVAADCAGFGFQIYPACIDCDVYNNVAYGMKVQSGFVLGGESSINELSRNMRVANNISANNARDGFLVYMNGTGGIAFDHNLASGNGMSAIAATDPGSIFTEVGTVSGDPSFVDPAALDFHLRLGSPAIDAGSSNLFAELDIDDQARPQGPVVDIGVDEVASGAPNGDAGDPVEPGGARGCGCRAARAEDTAAWVFVVALLLRRRRAFASGRRENHLTRSRP